MISELQRRCGDAEKTLSEMSSVVELARLRADNAEERIRNLSTAKWVADSEATSCALCNTRFSFSRRKVGRKLSGKPLNLALFVAYGRHMR